MQWDGAESHDGVHVISFERHSGAHLEVLTAYGQTCSSDATHFPCCHNNAESRSGGVRIVRRSLQCGDPLTTIGRRWMGGGVSPGQKLADPVSLSRSLALFREVEDVVAYAMANGRTAVTRSSELPPEWGEHGWLNRGTGHLTVGSIIHSLFT